ncbi:MAG: response regulator [Nitrosospira sp.]
MFPPENLILNVDDNEGARYAKTRILQNAGFQVVEVENGTDAIAFVKKNRPDLVLLDVKLPDINGIEVCRRIKEEPSCAAVLVLQTSAALTEREDKIRGLEGGADNYLVAPIEADELVANVRALLRLRSTQVELRNSEERFRELAENIDDVFWVLSSLNQVLYISPAYEQIWQRSMQNLRSHPDDWLDGVHEEDRQRVEKSFLAIPQHHKYDEEFRILQPSGSFTWVRDRAYAVKNSSHEIYRIVRITHDISIEKNAEHALREADKNKNTFLATLAHELRNPLAPIRNAVAIMQQMDDSPGEFQKKARDVIIRQVDHLAHLVDDLLDVARISQGKIILKKSRVELRTVIQAAVEAATPFLEERTHTFDLVMPEEEIWVDVDTVRLGQCIGNLLHNAAKFTPVGGRISLKAESRGDVAKISIKDNGIGISASTLSQVFDLFTQGEVAADQVQDGLGIGLSLTKKLIELHEGKIGVQSAGTGQGSIFSIEVPLSTAANDQPEKTVLPSLSKKSGESLRILVVDDNQDSREIMAMLLSTMGHEVFEAPDALAAIDLAKQNIPDAVISDIGLPKIDGYHIARELRCEPTLAGLKLIALTGYGALDDQQKSKEAGFDRHFVKPANMDELVSFLYEP